MPFGRFGRFPFVIGGGGQTQRVVRDGMLATLEPKPGLGYDTSDPLLKAEVGAQAGLVSLIWRVNARVKGSALPERMMEALPEAEQAYGLRPYSGQTDRERRLLVAAKARALPRNPLGDITAAVQKIAGGQFVGVFVASEAETYRYWPLNPGPPGFEWASNSRFIQVSLKKDGLPNDGAWVRLVAAVEGLLDSMLPVDMTFSVNTGTGFIIEESLIDEAAI